MALIEDNAKLLRLAATASVLTAVLLITVKLGAWYFTNSIGIMASLIDSLMDACASIINFFAIRYALMPADDDHKFGHGKAEALAGLSQAAFICGSVVLLLIQAVKRFIYPTEVEQLSIGIAVMVFSIIVTICLLAIQKYVIRKTQSAAIEADSLHYLSDLLSNMAILVSLLLIPYGFKQFDAVMGILVGLYILHGAVEIGKKSINILMDRELEPAEREAIFDLVLANKRVLGMHDLRTRQSGQTTFVQFHLELPNDMPLIQAHEIADEVEESFRLHYPHMEVTIHQDPHAISEASAPPERRINR